MSTHTSVPADRRLAVIAGAALAVSVLAVVVRAFGALPTEAAGGIALVGAGIALRVALLYAAKSSSSAARARVMTIVSTVGLAVSAVTLVAALPHVTRAAGTGRFVADTLAHLWTLALITAAAGPARTLGWRALLGTGFAGYLAVSSLARLVGTPVVHKLGTGSLFATAVWAPVTEEVLKALPLVLVIVLAVRRAPTRPSALDLALLGAWCGAGFGIYEDALYGRGGAKWSVNPPFSLVVPSELKATGPTTMIAGGHLVYTALIGLGLGVSVLYRRRWRRAWLAAPIAILVAVGEHVAVNAQPLLDAAGHEPLVVRILAPLTLGGRLSSIVLIFGIAGLAVVERRIAGRAPLVSWFVLRRPEAARRGYRLAAGQRPPVPSPPVPPSLPPWPPNVGYPSQPPGALR